MQKFALTHIKSFEESKEIELKPITVLVGKNSCGKSSLLRFPVMLAQTFRENTLAPLLLFGSLIDYGNYDDVAYRHGTKPIGFQMTFGQELIRLGQIYGKWEYVDGDERISFSHFKNVKSKVYIDKPGRKIQVQKFELYFDEKKICTINREKNTYTFTLNQILEKDIKEDCEIEITSLEMDFYNFIPVINEQKLLSQYLMIKNVMAKDKRIPRQTLLLKNIDRDFEGNVSDKTQQEIKNFTRTIFVIAGYLQAIRIFLIHEAEKTVYIGPFRENPKRVYRDSESSYNDVGVNGENTSMILRQAAQENQNLLDNVSGWFQKTMGYSLNIKDVGNGLYSIVVCGNREVDNLMDVGFGISQALPIVTQLYSKGEYRQSIFDLNMSERKTVILEQPEIHLHPAAQAQLADLFVDCINDKKGMINRILLETHSEHLIRKLQVLVADPDVMLKEDQVAIYYVDKDEKGDSHVQKMELCANGQFETAWPSGFFDKSYELTKLLMKANSKQNTRSGEA